jgi:hypothetical protein
MSESPPRRCTTCGRLVKGRCSVCDKAWARKPASWLGSANDRRWRKVRKLRLARNPSCCGCGAPASQVDHLDDTGYKDNTSTGNSWLNVAMTRSLCTTCHARRSARQSAAAPARPKR